MNSQIFRCRDHLGTMAAASVLVLAFLLAATPVGNSDYWLHLASGRALAEGRWQVDPFSYTAAESARVNPSWLYDLFLYGLFQLLGHPGLALAKSFFVAGLALALLAWARKGCNGLLVPALGTALALVALTPWLAFRPLGISLVFLILTQLLLERLRTGCSTDRRRFWLVGAPVLLFALWANLDRWFFLGPVLTFLYLTASFVPLPRPRARLVLSDSSTPICGTQEVRAARRLAAVVLICGSAACLISPYGVRNLQLPPEIFQGKTAGLVAEDPYLQGILYAPYRAIYSLTTCWNHPAGIAWWLLALFVMLSFGPDCRRWHADRLLLAVVFFALAIWLDRGIAFFACLAGPILAMNLYDRIAAALGHSIRASGTLASPMSSSPLLRQRWLPLVPGVLLPLAITPLVWTGLLQSGTLNARSWAIHMDPSLRRAAEQIARWREEGKLAHGAHGLNLSTDSGDVLAWLCPEEKSFVTSHLVLSAEALQDYALVRRALRSPEMPAPLGWRSIIRRRDIDHVIVYGEDLQPVLRKMTSNPAEWALLYVGGKVVILGWRDPQNSTNSFHGWELDFDGLAFGPQAYGFLPPSDCGAPAASWSVLLRDPPPRRTYCHDQAAVLGDYLLLTRSVQAQGNPFLSPYLVLCGWIGSAGTATPPPWSGVDPSFRLPLFPRVLDDVPLSVVYLAIRSARQAVREVPTNGDGHFSLALAYHCLHYDTRARVWSRQLPLLEKFYVEQACAGFAQAARLSPTPMISHARLAESYLGMGRLDMALDHLVQLRDSGARHGPARPQLRQVHEMEMLMLDRRIRQLGNKVEELLQEYDRRTGGMSIPARAQRAAALGLSAQALRLLLSYDQDLPQQLLKLKFTLLLISGRLAEAGACIDSRSARQLPPLDAAMMRVRLAAAAGEYEAADRALEKMTSGTDAGVAPTEAQARARLLRALLRLEDGKPAEARVIFGQALNFWNSPAGQLLVARSHEARVGWHIADHYLRLLDTQYVLPRGQQRGRDGARAAALVPGN